MLNGEEQLKKNPVVLLHAFPLSSEMWQPHVDSLSKDFRLITPDLTGLGKSPVKTKVSIEGMAEDIFKSLEDMNLKQPVFLAGLSMGGYVAFEFFRKYPERVKGLGLFSTRASADTPATREKRFQGIEKIEKEGLESFLGGNLPSLIGKTTAEKHPEILTQLKIIAGGNTPEGVANALAAIADRRDSRDLLKKMKCPVLILAGREDTVIPVSEAEALAEQIPNSMIHIFETAGHLFNLESPVEFERVFKKFIGGHF